MANTVDVHIKKLLFIIEATGVYSQGHQVPFFVEFACSFLYAIYCGFIKCLN